MTRRGDGTYFICQKDQIELLSAYLRAHDGVELKYQVAFAHHALYDSAVYVVKDRGGNAVRNPAGAGTKDGL